jgi:hypothetical protein
MARSKRTGESYYIRTTHLSGHLASQLQPLALTDGFVKSVSPPRLHYLSKNKDIVCRCVSRTHDSYKFVQNNEIRRLCAEYFSIKTMEVTCTRDQWRATVQDSDDTTCGAEEYTNHRSDEYVDKSRSIVERLQAQELLQAQEAKTSFVQPKLSKSEKFLQAQEARLGKRRPETTSSDEFLQTQEARLRKRRPETTFDDKTSFRRPNTSESDHEMHLRNGPGGEADISEELWRVSRPSVYLGQYTSNSVVSTPIGSSVSQVWEKTHSGRGNSLSILGFGTKAPGVRQLSEDDATCGAEELDYAGLGVYFAEPTRYSPSVPRPNTAELAATEPKIARVSSSIYSPYLPHHSPTLRELEGRGSHRVSEMPCRSTLLQEKNESRRLSGLSKLVSQPLKTPKLPSQEAEPLESPNLPNQEDFFLTHVKPCSRTHPAPVGDCTLCSGPYSSPNKHTILLPCTHHIHQECLLTRFRTHDFEYGHCSTCGMALCERTLLDRIETDRIAIFGATAFTPLPSSREERIDFPAHSQTILCRSEEEVAAAQLRLLKDYIDSHADEAYRLWTKNTDSVPDWHNQVIVPVVSLFKGWNVLRRQCKLFLDHDAFYKVVAWAELVRLVETLKEGVVIAYEGEAAFPSLAELHRKFLMAKERYEKEKIYWKEGREGVEWDRVVKVGVGLAVGMYGRDRS